MEGLANCLEQLWISYNNIDKLKNIGNLRKLKVLYMSNNKVDENQNGRHHLNHILTPFYQNETKSLTVQVSELSEFMRVGECPEINEVNFIGNPIQEMLTEQGTWTSTVSF